MNIIEKILAKHSVSPKKKKVFSGDLVNIKIDLILAHEVTTPPAISALEKNGIDKVFDKTRIVITPDHFIPNKDEKSAFLAKRLRDWAKRHKIKYYYEIGNHGICHSLLLEQGHVGPGMTVVAGDSHTCTHGVVGAFAFGIGSTELAAAIATGETWLEVPRTIKIRINGKLKKGVYSKDVILKILKRIGVDGATDHAVFFEGKTISDMDIEDRVTLTNMAVEAGGTVGIIEPDKKTFDYLRIRAKRKFNPVYSDSDAEFSKEISFDVSSLEPVIAMPPSPSNGKEISSIRKKINIDQAFIGSCTNGRINDLRIAAKILKDRKIAPYVRVIIIPATTKIWKQALKEGLFKIFTDAGATVSTPTCGPCLGGHMGVLAEGEKCIASSNRNFVGRMGHPKSEVYLGSPASVAASAVKGYITDPREFL